MIQIAKIEIENVVASASLADSLDLQDIYTKLDDAEYDPKRFPGLVYRLEEPKTATLLFGSGKVVCTGAKSIMNVGKAISKVAKDLESIGIKVNKDPEVKIQNIVATSDLGVKVNLNVIAITLGLENIEYEPEQFPGLVYRISEPKVVALLFGSGKMVCTGARTPDDVHKVVEMITRDLAAAGLI